LHQYALNLKFDSSYLEEDFIIASSNFIAKKWIDNWPNWQGSIFPNITCIYGPKGSGKTHLAHIWQIKASAYKITLRDLEQFSYRDLAESYLIDDIEQLLINEHNLLHFINYVIENKRFLLITARTKLHNLTIHTPDLRSRLQSFITYEIMPPNEELIEQMLVKSFSDLQILVNEEVIKFLTTHIDRSYEAVKHTIELLDKVSLSQNKKITIPLVKKALMLE
jgi:chromosomal replication initiation ATPase DnaA